MTKTIEQLKARIHLLQQRNPVVNNKLIKKLRRRIRLLESKANE